MPPTPDALLVAFGARVRAMRTARQMSQLDLAHGADLHPTYVSGVERGQRNVSLRAIGALARALDVELRELFDFEH